MYTSVILKSHDERSDHNPPLLCFYELRVASLDWTVASKRQATYSSHLKTT